MPELPEVETVKRSISPHVKSQIIKKVIIRQHQLRWPIPTHLSKILIKQTIYNVQRRSKYLLFQLDKGTLINHLGMSGRLYLVDQKLKPQKHDHVDIHLSNGLCLRYSDPRRFGALLWTAEDPNLHPLLADLGPEPLAKNFSGGLLFKLANNRKTPIKSFIMDSHVVVGVGNIYANEALFLAKIHPQRPANTLSESEYRTLAKMIKIVLKKAIAQGGTTLKDFVNGDGKPGYFSQYLHVYGRKNLPCFHCQSTLLEIRLNQRSTIYCANCQN